MFFNFSFILYKDKTFFHIINKMITFLRLKICTAKKSRSEKTRTGTIFIHERAEHLTGKLRCVRSAATEISHRFWYHTLR